MDLEDTIIFNENCERARALVVAENKCSPSFIQHHLRLGYNYAHDVVDELERRGIVSAADHNGKRIILRKA